MKRNILYVLAGIVPWFPIALLEGWLGMPLDMSVAVNFVGGVILGGVLAYKWMDGRRM